MVLKRMNTRTHLLRLTWSSGILASTLAMSWKAVPRGTSFKRCVDWLRTQKYFVWSRLLNNYTLMFSIIPKRKSPVTTKTWTKLRIVIYRDAFEVLSFLGASHFTVQKAICLETLGLDDGQHCKKLFEPWVEGIEKMITDHWIKDEGYFKKLSF